MIAASDASYTLAVLAAMANAISNVLQRKADSSEPAELSMRPRMVWDLLHRPVWLVGMGMVIVSFVLTVAALSLGRLAAVQPIVVLELPLTFIVASRLLGARLGRREWIASGAMALGLAGLIVSLQPSAGTGGTAPAVDWAIATSVTGGAVGLALVGALTSAGSRRAALLGLAAGVSFGLTAAFMKGMTGALHGGVVGVLSAWQTYAMVAGGLAAMFLAQNALQAGRLLVAQPGITLADPVVAIVWGVVVFHESTNRGFFLLAALASAGILAAGVVLLARSPLLEQSERGPRVGAGRR